jgi:phosphatidylinositol alpha-1,6-mannosyltransferase
MPYTNRYLVVCPAYPPPFVGGSKVWVFNMVENCTENFDILTSTLKNGFDEISNTRTNIYRSKFIWDSNIKDPTRWELLVSYAYIILWVIARNRKTKYKAIIAGAFDFANGFLFLLGKIIGVPVIGLGLAEEFTLSIHGKGLKYLIKRRWMKLTHKIAAGFIVVCDFCLNVLISIGVDKEKIHVVPSAISPQKYNPKMNKSKNGYKILSVGRIVERKGFHALIDAVNILKNKLPEIRVNIVGEGPYKSVLQEKIILNKLEKHVFLKGFISDEELADLYTESDIFVLAHMMLDNGDTEGCPTVFSEAGIYGIPVIGGVDGGASTVIEDGVTGYIVDSKNINLLAEKIERILADKKLAAEMGKAGKQKILRDHTPEIIGKKFANAIQIIVH